MKYLLYISLILGVGNISAQVISPQVLNAAGNSRALGSTGVSISDNVGEPFTLTLGSGASISQGFLQPDALTLTTPTVILIHNDVPCHGRNEGNISTAITAVPGYSLVYVWTPTTVCPAGNCSSLDSLSAGVYTLQATFTYTTAGNKIVIYQITDTVVIRDVNGPCKVKVFTGVNINGSNQNDHMYIQNIEEFPNNRVTIYNRWGIQLYDQRSYDNTTVYWPSQDDRIKLLPSTYFYVLDLGDGSKAIKGWVELIKN